MWSRDPTEGHELSDGTPVHLACAARQFPLGRHSVQGAHLPIDLLQQLLKSLPKPGGLSVLGPTFPRTSSDSCSRGVSCQHSQSRRFGTPNGDFQNTCAGKSGGFVPSYELPLLVLKCLWRNAKSSFILWWGSIALGNGTGIRNVWLCLHCDLHGFLVCRHWRCQTMES